MTVIQSIGVLMLGLVVAQLVVGLVSILRQSRLRLVQERLHRETLSERLATIRTMRRTMAEGGGTWSSFRKFKVVHKEPEAREIFTFHLEPHDRGPISAYQPGQFLTVRLQLPGESRPQVRCYSLSDCFDPEQNRYRLTIKRIPGGRVSGYLCDRVKVGDILDVRAPRGRFVLDVTRPQPVVLVAGGIGVTPLYAMVRAVAQHGIRRETWLFYGVQNKAHMIRPEALDELAREHAHIRLVRCFSQPRDDEQAGIDYEYEGRVTVQRLQQVLPSSNYRFFVCGPPSMIEEVREGLNAWGVPADRVAYEAFGSETIRRLKPALMGAGGGTVTFSRSERSLLWEDGCDSLLELATREGVDIPSGCLVGDCQSCLTAITAGRVKYLKEPGNPPETGSCLPCIAVPEGDVTLVA